MPEIYTRAQWGADESIREPGDPDYGQVLGTFVHHTAGTNSYTEADVPAIIRSIYAYHVDGRGWRDIGYNFLVDRFGRIWEGRYGGVDRAVIGAHTAGYNSSAFGTSVLGTYTSKAPEDAVPLRVRTTYRLEVHAARCRTRCVGRVSGARDASGDFGTPRRQRDRMPGSTALRQAERDPARYHCGHVEGPSSDAVFRVQGPDRVATAIDASQSCSVTPPPGLRPWCWHARTCSRTRWPEFLSPLRRPARC